MSTLGWMHPDPALLALSTESIRVVQTLDKRWCRRRASPNVETNEALTANLI